MMIAQEHLPTCSRGQACIAGRREPPSESVVLAGVRGRRRRNNQDLKATIKISFGDMVKCPYCKSQTQFCRTCKAKFADMIPPQMLETIARTEDDDENKSVNLFNALRELVDEQEAQNRRVEATPGGATTRSERRQTRMRALGGLAVDTIAENLARDRREKEGMLVSQSPLDAMPPDYVKWIAGINDETRSWMHAYQKRVEAHKAWLSSPEIEAVVREDEAIDVNARLPGLDSRPLKMPRHVGKPAAAAKLPPVLHEVHARIEKRAKAYLEERNTYGYHHRLPSLARHRRRFDANRTNNKPMVITCC